MNTLKYILLITFIIFISCKKEYTTTVIEGRVVNAGSKEPIDSVLVVLQDGVNNVNGFFSIGDNNTKGTGISTFVYTDKNGYFKISLQCETPVLWLEKIGYVFNVKNGGSSQSIKGYNRGKYSNEVLDLIAKAYFNPILKGTQSKSTDSIGIGEGYTIPNNYQMRSLFSGFGNGPLSLYSDNGLYAFGDFYYVYWLKFQINGVWHEKVDSVYIKSFTTYRDTIHY